jgi:hypothetical protein
MSIKIEGPILILEDGVIVLGEHNDALQGDALVGNASESLCQASHQKVFR